MELPLAMAEACPSPDLFPGILMSDSSIVQLPGLSFYFDEDAKVPFISTS